MGALALLQALAARLSSGHRRQAETSKTAEAPTRPRHVSALTVMPSVREATRLPVRLHAAEPGFAALQSGDPLDDFPEFKRLRRCKVWTVQDAAGDLWLVEVRRDDRTGAVYRGCFAM